MRDLYAMTEEIDQQRQTSPKARKEPSLTGSLYRRYMRKMKHERTKKRRDRLTMDQLIVDLVFEERIANSLGESRLHFARDPDTYGYLCAKLYNEVLNDKYLKFNRITLKPVKRRQITRYPHPRYL